jgi:Bacteriophage baseplate protein W
MSERAFLGTGWSFPVRVDARGRLTYVSDEEGIEQAIWIALGTARGEREMLPEYGSGIHDYVFSPNDETTRGHLADQVRQTLTRWEPRIDVLDVSVESGGDDDNLILIRVDYRIRTTNSFHNLVYPFYVQEGIAA